MQTSGSSCREIAKSCQQLQPAKVCQPQHVIASEAKQSIVRHEERMDCFAALAMTIQRQR